MTNTNDIGTAAAGSDFDDVYEKSLDELRASRSGRLDSRTLGVLSTSIALGDGREYVRRANRALLMTNDSLSSEIVLRPCKDTIDTILLTLLPPTTTTTTTTTGRRWRRTAPPISTKSTTAAMEVVIEM